MPGLQPDTPLPAAITVHQQSRMLELAYADGQVLRIPFELLRVSSPSAEVQGHGPGQEVLQTGKREVEIVALEAVGHYAVQPTFSDGHASGIYSWALLHDLGLHGDERMRQYLQRLAEAGLDRDAPMDGGPPAGGAGCGHPH